MVAQPMTKTAKVWTVDLYTDRIRIKSVADVQREENHPFFPKTVHKFQSRDKALEFCVQRADRAAVYAKKELDNAWKRMKRLRKMQAEAGR